jgi:hypothetical protein
VAQLTSSAPPRRRLFQHPGRVAIVVVALLVVLNLGILLLNGADTSQGGGTPTPATVQSVSPSPHAIAGPVDTVTVDLDDSLTGVLLIKQNNRFIEIPEDQLDRIVGLSQISFRPGPDKDITRFVPGPTEVVVLYWSKTAPGGRPANPASYSWAFDVKA